MLRSSAARLGIPVRQLTVRILVPFGFILVGLAVLLSFFTTGRLHERSLFEQQVTAKTLFETQASVHSTRNGLAVLSENRGYERVWVLSATGDILDSNRKSDIGTQLDTRWWDLLKDQKTGFIQVPVDFGSQTLSLTALHHAEMGRWVVIVSQPRSIWSLTLLYIGLILIVGLILWLIAAALIWGTLSQKVASPIRKLDDRTIELIQGAALTEAALEKLLAETTPSLGAHADYVVNLARKLRSAEGRSTEAQAQFKHLFNSIPSLAFIRTPGGKVGLANRALAERMSVDPAWIEAQPLHMLKGVVPVTHLENWFSKKSSGKVGIERMELFPAFNDEIAVPIVLTIQPIQFEQLACHLVVVEERSKSDAPLADDHEWAEASLESISKGEIDLSFSGDGSSLELDIAPQEPKVDLLEGLMAVTGQFVVVFNEEAKTIFWSPSAEQATGIVPTDIPDMKAFTEKIFSTRQERKLFKDWIDGAPDERSQELKIRTTDGVVTSRWHASELELKDAGLVGVLWAQLDTHLSRRSTQKREPVGQ